MKTIRPTFEQTIDKLVRAYLKGTLVNGHPCGCAIGNIIASNYGFNIETGHDGPHASWDGDEEAGFSWFYVLRPEKKCGFYDLELGKKQLQMTGYSMDELDKIEAAFEDGEPQVCYDDEKEERMFNGLMAVTDILAEIHGVNLEIKQNAKTLFVKA